MDGLMNGIASVTGQIAAVSQLELNLAQATWAGSTGVGFRPADVPEGRGFCVALSSSLHSAEALFVPDAFAGALVRGIGEVVAFHPEEWLSLEKEAREEDVSVSIAVNGEYQPNLSKLPQDAWRSLEIECLKRRRRGDTSVLEHLLAVGRYCLSFALAGLTVESDESNPEGLPEGASVRVLENRYERNPVNRMRCIEFYGPRCWVCEFDFAGKYGELGAGFIVVHHTTPVSKMGAGYLVNPVRDLIPLCPNCHAMVHRQDPPLAPEVLRHLLALPDRPRGEPTGGRAEFTRATDVGG